MTKDQPAGPGAADTELLGALALLQQRRQPYAELLAGIVLETIERFPPASGKLVAEIGSGSGQLRDWVSPDLRGRMVHTDPSESALKSLRQRAPDAKTRPSPAERLPFGDGSCAAVLGLCVFDAIQDQAAVVAEVARVLTPGGRFVHFMDMATLLEAPFEKLAASGLVPIPNVFGDPADHEWPLDIVLVQRDWLRGLLDFAARNAHPLVAGFGGYFGAFLADPFDVQAATSIFKSIASNGEMRRALVTFLESTGRLSFQQGYPAIEPLPFHSGRYLQSVLDTAFKNNDAFRIELSQIVTKSRWLPREGASTVSYRSLCLGHQRIMNEHPRRLLTDSAQERISREGPPPDETLIEAGVFVFVAQRV
jgi:ubiquinone/menaquinone biosynthesis C-methylase UbiE